MTRAGLALAALAAAGITAGSIGFAVFWAYGPGDVPRVTAGAPESETSIPPGSNAGSTSPEAKADTPPGPAPTASASNRRPAQAPAVPAGPVPPAAAPQVASQPAAPTAEAPRPPARKQESTAALPQSPEKPTETPGVASEPQVGVVRGGRSAATHPRAPQERQPIKQPRSQSVQTASDARPIIVLRGGRGPRYAMLAAAEPSSQGESLPLVIRGTRPRPSGFHGYVQPGALILHIRD